MTRTGVVCLKIYVFELLFDKLKHVILSTPQLRCGFSCFTRSWNLLQET